MSGCVAVGTPAAQCRGNAASENEGQSRVRQEFSLNVDLVLPLTVKVPQFANVTSLSLAESTVKGLFGRTCTDV